jgi:hypothetical protein
MLENYYGRANRKERKFLKSYQETDSICIPKIRFHHKSNTGRGTTGSLSIRQEDIVSSLSQSYSNSFNLSFCGSNKDSPSIEDSFLKNNRDIYHDMYGKEVIVPDLIITSYTSRNIEGGGGLTFVEDMGNDRHRVEIKLVSSIYQNDTLVYMDNRTYWTEVLSERDERLRYQVPQEVIDTLVKLSLEEYFKRMK